MLADQFRITPETALTVFVTTACMYLALVVLLRVVGPRSLASLAGFDFPAVVALGAVMGRTILLAEPTLMIGLVALVSLFIVQGALGAVRQDARFDRWVHRPPTVLVLDGELLTANMRRVHIVEEEIRQAVRRAGASSVAEISCIVLERNGALSVVRAGNPLDPWLLSGVYGVPAGYQSPQ